MTVKNKIKAYRFRIDIGIAYRNMKIERNTFPEPLMNKAII